MRIALISDIHGNLEAFRQVLADIDRLEIATIFSLGDIVGYGPDPEEVVNELRARQIVSVKGNHELALNSPRYFLKMNPNAQQSLLITKKLLSGTNKRYLESLETFTVFQGARFVHGCPPQSITTYLFNPSSLQLNALFSFFPEKICFIGHTHYLSLFGFDGEISWREELTGGTISLAEEKRYIVNIGSVGQPRDRQNNNAKYVLWDIDENTLEVRFVPYDISITAAKIYNRGFPEYNATRLW